MESHTDRQADIKTNRLKERRLDGRKNEFIKRWIENGCKERATERP